MFRTPFTLRGSSPGIADASRAFATSWRWTVVDAALALRALAYVGRRYRCPCCGWRLRTFTHGGVSLRARHHGYCPRCNSKARHRRDWLYLESATNLFSAPLRLLHVSPKYSLSRRFVTMPNLDYVAIDVTGRPHVSARADVAELPFSSGSFDAAICIHVLEHVERDTAAMRALYRVLKPNGWALISVPIRFDRDTHEDPSITDPEEREREFGETSHVRFYGRDLRDRLEACGFDVHLDLAEELDEATKARYGLLDDENVFFCRKPEGGA